jgi:hypothetical protein
LFRRFERVGSVEASRAKLFDRFAEPDMVILRVSRDTIERNQ